MEKRIMINNKNMVNLNRPLPFTTEHSESISVIEVIKKLKSFAVNNDLYNKYFDKYYNITSSECEKSEMSKILNNNDNNKNNERNNKIPLHDNNFYMEYM